jgi:hypothetical protein
MSDLFTANRAISSHIDPVSTTAPLRLDAHRFLHFNLIVMNRLSHSIGFIGT